MRHLTFICCIVFLLFSSCSDKKGQATGAIKQDTTFLPINYDYNKLEGVYQGDFGGSDIHISLRHVNGRHAMGYSLHKGLKRNFSGNMKPGGTGFAFTLREPGNNQYDGVFDFVVDTVSFVAKGNWSPNDKKSLTAKNFTLKRVSDSGYEFTLSFNDSVGGLFLQTTGLCVYETYLNENTPNQPPPEIAHGNWTREGNVVTIEWEQNKIFPSRKTILNVTHEVLGSPPDNTSAEFIMLDGMKLYADY